MGSSNSDGLGLTERVVAAVRKGHRGRYISVGNLSVLYTIVLKRLAVLHTREIFVVGRLGFLTGERGDIYIISYAESHIWTSGLDKALQLSLRCLVRLAPLLPAMLLDDSGADKTLPRETDASS